jgi:hypothetical protein
MKKAEDKTTTRHYVQTGIWRQARSMSKETKTEIVKIRMTAREKTELQKLAGQYDMNMSDYIRRVSARPPNVTRDEFDDSVIRVIYEINKIGVNINQIAKKYNENKYVKPSAELLRMLEKTNELLHSVTLFYNKRG